MILENIEYDHLCREFTTYREDLDEIVELMVETVCAKRKTTRIAGSDFPHEVVRSRFLKLDCSHIEFVMDCLQKNTTQVRSATTTPHKSTTICTQAAGKQPLFCYPKTPGERILP